jgi:hypothetical protein
MSEEACRFCEGTGRVSVDRCAEIVNGRRCKNTARNDPSYFEAYPDREFIRPYCGMHGNQRARARLESPAERPGPAAGREEW